MTWQPRWLTPEQQQDARDSGNAAPVVSDQQRERLGLLLFPHRAAKRDKAAS